MATNKQGSVSSTNWNKWQIALAVGAPLALGLGYWYLKTNRQNLKRLEAGDNDESALVNTKPNDRGDHAQKNPAEQAQVMKTNGNVLFKSGKYLEAIDCYTEAIRLCPAEKTDDVATFYQNRAAAHEQLKNYEDVIKDCSKSLDLNIRYVKALNRRAKAYEISNQLMHALEDLTTICILEGFQNESTLMSADRILKQLGKVHVDEAMKTRKPVSPSKHFITTYFSSFSQDPIMNDWKISHEQSNGSIGGFLKAQQDLQHKNYETIIEDCTDELKTTDSRFTAESLLLRGTFYVLHGQTNLAEKDFEDIIKLDSPNVKVKANALIKYGSLIFQRNIYEYTFGEFEAAEKLDPTNSDIYHHRGQLQLLMDRTDEALKEFKKSVELNPKFPVSWVQKCFVDYRAASEQRNMDALQQAVNSFEQALVKFPNCVEAYSLYGQILAERSEFPKADECYLKGLSIDPDNASLYVHRGLMQLSWKQNIENAVALMNEAITRDPKFEYGYETLGTLEVQRGNLERALQLFNKAITLAKSETELAHVYSLHDAALAQVQVAKRLGSHISALIS